VDRGVGAERQSPLETVQWELTRRCEQLCQLCFLSDSERSSEQLSTEECLRVVDELAAMDVQHVHLFGGEAHLRSDYLEILEAVASKGINVALTSGSPRFPIDEVARVAGDKISHVMLSIDGLEATHDELRNCPGSFSGILSILEKVRSHDIPCGVSTQVNRRNLRELKTLTKLLFMMGIRLWHTQITEPFGRARSHFDKVLQPYELPNVVEILVSIKQEALRQGISIKLGNNIGYNTDSIRWLREDDNGVDATGCKQGLTYLAIQADGTIKGCASCASGIGTCQSNIRTTSLREIWNRNEEFDWTRNRSAARLWGYCGECEHGESCYGGCVQTSQALFGRPGNNPYCGFRVHQLAAKGVRERVDIDEQKQLHVTQEAVPGDDGAQE